jgi:ABC-type transporter Mla MlaB component
MGASAPRTAALTIRGPITRADLPGLTDRVCAVLREHRGGDVLCDVRDLPSDCMTIDALARLQLAARRHACRVRLHRASDELLELVAFMGLEDVLPE